MILMKLDRQSSDLLDKLSGFFDWSFYDEFDVYGLEMFGRDSSIKKMYSVGPYLDLAPVILLDSCIDYYYQDLHKIIKPIKTALRILQNEGIVHGLKETIHINKESSYAELNFSVGKNHKNLFVFEKSDAITRLIPQVSEVDLIYALGSLVTEEMLKKAKSGCLILDHPGIQLDKYRINDSQISKYNLILVVYLNTDTSIFRYSSVYRKR